ncbi:hypothetical protein JHK85_035084 [Glycine max]|nr:hypothetical protein JHK85_035084 [Glycine max]
MIDTRVADVLHYPKEMAISISTHLHVTCVTKTFKRVPEGELPAVDLFVTTADPVLEPPIITINTVLSLLALDYPHNKLACYVSDDGCSPLTFYALIEAFQFAKLWVPFCKKYNIQLRVPFRYFSNNTSTDNNEDTPEFMQDWLKMKNEYERLTRKILNATKNSIPLVGEFAIFSDTQPRNHPTIIKVIWENKEGLSDELPHLIYVSREKKQEHPHQYKAGAMNVLYLGGGLAGLQGIFYLGTNCMHRRKVIYGLSPYHGIQNGKKDHGVSNGKFSEKKTIFGTSKGFVESATHALEGKTFTPNNNICKSLEAASEVSSCEYEYGTAWGKQVGWMYGSTSEDLLTGLKIHTKGWRSEVCSPELSPFMGCSPQDILVVIGQQKRWISGLLDILLSKHCPIFGTLFGKLQFRQCLGYLWITTWSLRPVPEICYAALPAYCIINNSSFLPKELGQWIPATLLVIYNVSTLLENLKIGLSIRTWCNNQRMARITTMNSWFFGFLAILLKRLRISNIGFEITRKDETFSNEGANENDGRFIFNKSPVFIPGTTILLIQLTALVTMWLGWQPPVRNNGHGSGVGEDEYGELTLKIENTATKPNLFQPVGEHAEFSKAQPTNHPTILKVIWENEKDLSDGIPHLIYTSREKRPEYSHH